MKLIVAFTFFLSQLIIGAWNIDNTFINVAKHTDELMLVRAIQIIDPANAWAITHNNLYRYQDSTWSEKSPGGPFSLMSIHFKIKTMVGQLEVRQFPKIPYFMSLRTIMVPGKLLLLIKKSPCCRFMQLIQQLPGLLEEVEQF